MKKVLSIFAVVVMSIGMFSCESETNLEETQALFENINATDGDEVPPDGRN